MKVYFGHHDPLSKIVYVFSYGVAYNLCIPFEVAYNLCFPFGVVYTLEVELTTTIHVIL